MGGGSYDRDVYTSTTSTGGYAVSAASAQKVGARKLNKALLPFKRRIECSHQNPIVLELDGTGSNIGAARVFYDKMPMLWGQIIQQGLLADPSISFAVNGDAGRGDDYPLQVCDFNEGIALDNDLGEIVLEGGGGSNSVESYELAARFYANHCQLIKGAYGFYFLLADEGVYDSLDPQDAKEVLGETLKNPVSTKTIFQALKKKFGGNVFLIHLPYGSDYQDRPVVLQWIELLGANHVLCINEPKAMVDVILGVIAIVSGKRTLEEYKVDMAERGQNEARIRKVAEALKDVVPSATSMPEPAVDEADGETPTGPNWV